MSYSDAVAYGELVEMAKSKIDDGGMMSMAATKLELFLVPGLSRAPVKFELQELNHQQYRKTTLIGVVYGSPIAMKGVTLACKN